MHVNPQKEAVADTRELIRLIFVTTDHYVTGLSNLFS